MNISFTPLQPLFAAEVSAIDLRETFERSSLEQIRAGMEQYGVLVFRNQLFKDEE